MHLLDIHLISQLLGVTSVGRLLLRFPLFSVDIIWTPM